jgi:hypothetical protein
VDVIGLICIIGSTILSDACMILTTLSSPFTRDLVATPSYLVVAKPSRMTA